MQPLNVPALCKAEAWIALRFSYTGRADSKQRSKAGYLLQDEEQQGDGDDDQEVGEDGNRVEVHEGEAQPPDRPRMTTRYMTKYERARVLGTRALQIRSVWTSCLCSSVNHTSCARAFCSQGRTYKLRLPDTTVCLVTQHECSCAGGNKRRD